MTMQSASDFHHSKNRETQKLCCRKDYCCPGHVQASGKAHESLYISFAGHISPCKTEGHVVNGKPSSPNWRLVGTAVL